MQSTTETKPKGTRRGKTTKTVAGKGQTAEKSPPTSIRQTIKQGLLAGRSTAEIKTILEANFPKSQAAAKANKHIAFYRSQMVKAGELARAERPVAQATA